MKINLISPTESALRMPLLSMPFRVLALAAVLQDRWTRSVEQVRSVPTRIQRRVNACRELLARIKVWFEEAPPRVRTLTLGTMRKSQSWVVLAPERSWHALDSRAAHLAEFLDTQTLKAISPALHTYKAATLGMQRYWASRWVIRRGFILIMVVVTSVAGSSLWAIMSLPYLPGHPIPEYDVFPAMPEGANAIVARAEVPSELAWFFIKFPYLSSDIKIQPKNHHTFIVVDSPRKREYVVNFGQTYRRVEIYFADNKGMSQVRLFTPGKVRMVSFTGPRVSCDVTNADANDWMFKAPLWNAMHIKIYSMADFWLDSPYKRNSCAGFVHQYLKDAGVPTPLLDAWDIAKLPWARIPIDEMEPGDIVTIRAASAGHRRYWHHSVTHVGVYLGHGKIIHAATPSLKARRSWVRITSVDAFRKRIDKVIRPPSLL